MEAGADVSRPATKTRLNGKVWQISQIKSRPNDSKSVPKSWSLKVEKKILLFCKDEDGMFGIQGIVL